VRVLIVNANRRLVGGVEKYLQTVIPALAARGHEIALLHESEFEAGSERVDPAGLPVWRAAGSLTAAALDAVRGWKPSVVYSQGVEQPDLERALLDSYPTVLYGHNYYGTCVTGRKCHSFPQFQTCERRMGLACLGLYYPRRCGGLNVSTMWRLYQRQTQLHSRLEECRAILVASKHMQREFQTNGVSPDKVHVVALPAAAEGALLPEPARVGHQGRILFVGRLTDIKGADHLIRALPLAAKKLGRALTLTIAGDGSERQKLQGLADQPHVTVEFAGWVETSRKFELMRQADLLAVPSLWPEPFGMVGMEAAMFGVPAVGYAVGGIPEWLIPGRTGELATGDPPTVEGLADAIERAFRNPDHYSAISRQAWEASREYTLERHLALLEPRLQAASAVPAAGLAEVSGLVI
jgi:glycosyltransferase involved in cell wall biosynthesis